MENGGMEMLDELYQDNQLPKEKHLSQCDITLGIDTSNIPQTMKVSKSMTEEEAEATRSKNEDIRKQREDTATTIATKFAQFKRDFLGAPIRKAMNNVKNKKNDFKPCQINYRKDERYWVFGSDKDVRVIFEVNFTDAEDIALARIFLLEQKDTRSVLNAPAIAYHDKAPPQEVVAAFPGAMDNVKTSNGSISFLIGEKSINKGMDQPLSQLIGFRQYLHYHLHAIKI